MPYQKLNQKYINGKQVITLATILLTMLGFALDAFTYYSIYSPIQVIVQSASFFACLVALVLYLLHRQRYFKLSYGIISYTVIFNIIATSTIIHTFISFQKFTEANILSRDIIFIILYISLSGFILGRIHIFLQGLLLLGLVIYFVTIRRDEFFIDNAAIYFLSCIGFSYALYFFVGTLNNLIKGLEEATISADQSKQLEAEKNEVLLRYQNSLLQLTQNKSQYDSSLDDLFARICSTASRDLSTSRVSIWMMGENNSRIVRRHLFELQSKNDEAVILERKDFPNYFRALEESPFILANDACEHPATKEFKDVYLNPLSIVSMLDCPILIDGLPIGVVCCEHQHLQQNWGTEDVLYVQSLSEHISLCFKNLEINSLVKQLRLTNNQLIDKSNEVETMNEELSSLNEELSTLNESLEAAVKRRTSELETQNIQLTEYAFINSHILRAPLARILGLAQLISRESISIKDESLVKALIQSSNELDSIIRKISDLLYDGNNLSREDIQGIINRRINSN
jgi:GAF domain-containing protein